MKILLSTLALLSLWGCTKKPEKPTIWIYTSIYNHVIQDLNRGLAARFPDVEIKWYQSGSETVAAKLGMELLAGKPQADLLLTSDPFYYEDLKAQNALLKYDSPATSSLPIAFKDPDRFWAIVRVPAVVIAYHSDAIGPASAPMSFSELADAKFKGKVAMASPLESGTTFTAVAVLSKRLGWDFFTKLRANEAISTGGNSSVMAKLETKERPIGIVLLENIIAAKRRNPKITAVYPRDGVVLVPSPIAILASTKHPELSKNVYDYFFSQEGQEKLARGGDQHGVIATAPPPEGASPLFNLISQSFPWDAALIRQVRNERAEIKKQFTKIMLE